jgi:signal peptidase I
MSTKNRADFLVRYSLQFFAVVLILGIGLRTFVVSSFVMSGQSMLPSIWPGDFILAAKWRTQSLRRGDVVALRCPNNRDEICLKRVVGLEGDRIEVDGGRLSVNGELAVLKPLTDHIATEVVSGESWLIWPQSSSSEPEPPGSGPLVVPPQHVYVLNDQREVVTDSRSWGPIKSNLIEARALRVWLSLDWFEEGQVRSWPRLRWERIFRGIN